MRSLKVEDKFVITGRGTAYMTRMADPPFALSEHVLIDGDEFEIFGIERAGSLPSPGMTVGLLCRPVVAPPPCPVCSKPVTSLVRRVGKPDQFWHGPSLCHLSPLANLTKDQAGDVCPRT